jgi:hypothetical protein
MKYVKTRMYQLHSANSIIARAILEIKDASNKKRKRKQIPVKSIRDSTSAIAPQW